MPNPTPAPETAERREEILVETVYQLLGPHGDIPHNPTLNEPRGMGCICYVCNRVRAAEILRGKARMSEAEAFHYLLEESSRKCRNEAEVFTAGADAIEALAASRAEVAKQAELIAAVDAEDKGYEAMFERIAKALGVTYEGIPSNSPHEVANRMTAAIDGAKKDSARLDWIEKANAKIESRVTGFKALDPWLVNGGLAKSDAVTGPTLRATIDSAIAQEPPCQEPTAPAGS